MKKILIVSLALLSIVSVAEALDYGLVISGSVGGEYGKLDTKYSAEQYTTTGGGIVSDPVNILTEYEDYTSSGYNYQGTIGISIRSESILEHRIFVVFQRANTTLELDNENVTLHSQDAGIGYQLFFGKGSLRPFIGTNLTTGKTDGDGDPLGYYGIHGYVGLAYEILEGFDAVVQLGLNNRVYDEQSESFTYQSGTIETTTVTETLENDYTGVDAKVGLAYRF
ncbi:MAG: hypothetical protein WBG65_00445 [Sulfurimonadaceae bacterium]